MKPTQLSIAIELGIDMLIQQEEAVDDMYMRLEASGWDLDFAAIEFEVALAREASDLRYMGTYPR